MVGKTNKITFIAEDEYVENVCPKPYPASKSIPEWFKNQNPYGDLGENNKIIVRNYESNATFKKCQPMLDGLTAGYIFPLWTDVTIEEDKIPYINWRVREREVFGVHAPHTVKMDTPTGYNKQAFKYFNMWHIKTPPGYSVLITSPFGYQDLPFKAITAIIDTDKTTHPITVPVWVKDNFSGIVEKGTPMFQAIPFKRENWESDFTKYKDGEFNMLMDKNVKSTIVNNYIKNFWTKKSYK
jgi:hypothetical protein